MRGDKGYKRYLLVNLGNTNCQFAIGYRNGYGERTSGFGLERVWSIPTEGLNCDVIIQECRDIITELSQKGASIHPRAFISSVVHKKDTALKDALLRLLRQPPVFVSPSMDRKFLGRLGIKKIDYEQAESLGADRLLNAIAAYQLYSRRNVIIVDIGTAINFDCLSQDGIFLGGAIAPGPFVSKSALIQHAEGLYDFVLSDMQTLTDIGKNTNDCLKIGFIIGFSGLIDRIIQYLSSQMDDDVYAVATGGGAEVFSRFCKEINDHVQFLTLKGLLFFSSMDLYLE